MSQLPENFYDLVWDLVRQIPEGQVMSYGGIAGAIGHPRNSRAVGRAMHLVPSDPPVPWHRVVNSSGGISTCSEPGCASSDQKRKLEAEGVKFSPAGKVSMKKYGWNPFLE